MVERATIFGRENPPAFNSAVLAPESTNYIFLISRMFLSLRTPSFFISGIFCLLHLWRHQLVTVSYYFYLFLFFDRVDFREHLCTYQGQTMHRISRYGSLPRTRLYLPSPSSIVASTFPLHIPCSCKLKAVSPLDTASQHNQHTWFLRSLGPKLMAPYC